MDSSLPTRIETTEYGLEAFGFFTNKEIQNTAVTWQDDAYGVLGHAWSDLVPLYGKVKHRQ
jgi:hypothetical protein